jgi:DNA-binding GntR family transcriptional regulator
MAHADNVAVARTAAFQDGESGSMSDQLVHELQRRILVGEIPVGSWLRHGALADEFGISRTPVREALRILNSQGIVTIVQNRGARVNGHSSRDIRELGEVRAELEGLAAAQAAERIDDAQLERLLGAWRGYRDAIDRFVEHATSDRSADDAKIWVDANRQFHDVILEAAGNRQLEISIGEVHRRLPQNTSYSAYAGNSRLLRANVDQHEAIADAIVLHDSAAARKAMTAHIRSSIEAMARWAEDHAVVRDN